MTMNLDWGNFIITPITQLKNHSSLYHQSASFDLIRLHYLHSLKWVFHHELYLMVLFYPYNERIALEMIFSVIQGLPQDLLTKVPHFLKFQEFSYFHYFPNFFI